MLAYTFYKTTNERCLCISKMFWSVKKNLKRERGKPQVHQNPNEWGGNSKSKLLSAEVLPQVLPQFTLHLFRIPFTEN